MSFEELMQPHVEQKVSGYIGMWFCPNMHWTRFLAVDSNGLELKRLDKRNVDQYFWNSEEEAHQAAAQWYNMHGYMYPYNDEWERSKNRIPAKKKNDVLESQVMDFV